jgi:hypothetical protein
MGGGRKNQFLLAARRILEGYAPTNAAPLPYHYYPGPMERGEKKNYGPGLREGLEVFD